MMRACDALVMRSAATRLVPMYMYTLDLCFAASFTVCAEWMKLEGSGHGASSSAVGRFFLLFLPLARQWDHTNCLFNRFDVEDAVSEGVVVLMMTGAMVTAVNVRACFFESDLPHPSDEPPDPRISDDSCRYFLVAVGATRLVLTAFTLYVALYVADARPRAWRELLLLALTAVYAATFVAALSHWQPVFAPSASRTSLQAFLFGASLLDTALFMTDDFLPPAAAASAQTTHAGDGGDGGGDGVRKSRCAMLWTAVRMRVPLDGEYLVRRHERMVIISVGTLVADAIRATLDDISRFDFGALLVCVGTPTAALLLKVFYFDLSQYHGADAGMHAVMVSPARAACWSLLHLPLLGTILWIGVSAP